jgi:hypothetical protein
LVAVRTPKINQVQRAIRHQFATLSMPSAYGLKIHRVQQAPDGSGPGGRRFKSSLPDQSFQALKLDFWFSVYIDGVDFVDGHVFLRGLADFQLSFAICFSSKLSCPVSFVDRFPIRVTTINWRLRNERQCNLVLRGCALHREMLSYLVALLHSPRCHLTEITGA